MTLVADDIFEKANLLHEAPSAKMYLWIAELNLLKASKEENKIKRIKTLFFGFLHWFWFLEFCVYSMFSDIIVKSDP